MKFKDILVVDIDGTIADIEHRKHFIDGSDGRKDWNRFYSEVNADKPIFSTIMVVDALMHVYRGLLRCVFLTGRPESLRADTMAWLHMYVPGIWDDTCTDMPLFNLVMRIEGDYRPDYIVKREQFIGAGYKMDDILLVLEDRQQVVDMWRKHDVQVFQVAKGDF